MISLLKTHSRSLLLAGFIAVLLLLDWAALMDILRATQLDYTLEYAMLGGSGTAFLLIWLEGMLHRPV